jgi:hypothetical protein
MFEGESFCLRMGNGRKVSNGEWMDEIFDVWLGSLRYFVRLLSGNCKLRLIVESCVYVHVRVSSEFEIGMALQR